MNDLEQFNDESKNLEILAEECAEVIQIKSKITRFGMYDFNPTKNVINRDQLVQELGDVMAMIEILTFNGLFQEWEIEQAMERKLEKLKEWY